MSVVDWEACAACRRTGKNRWGAPCWPCGGQGIVRALGPPPTPESRRALLEGIFEQLRAHGFGIADPKDGAG